MQTLTAIRTFVRCERNRRSNEERSTPCTDSAPPIDETACVAEELAGEVSQDDLRTLLEAVEVDDSDVDPTVALAFNDAIDACGLS